MPNVILYLATSLDGFISRKDGSVDWLITEGDCGYNEFLKTIDTIIMGRKSYDQLLTFGKFPYGDKRCIVFSKTKTGNDENVEFVSGKVSDIIKNIEGNVWLFGGSDMITSCLKEGVVDQMMIFIQPTLIGEGIPLFGGGYDDIQMILDDVKTYDNGFVGLTYNRKV